ncbi:MAG TPA: Rv2640c family ArsR-like transcriptional regulator [Mycobacteriales bacterium]|nr:Rv2640c family ArsR-like transcriptional regulator [Mycobacteriales bacterium]
MPKPLPVLDVRSPVCCAPIGAERTGDDAALQVALRLKALADPVRIRLMSILLTGPEACNGDLAGAVGLTDATVSHHLGQLLAAGLVERERRGMNVYYRAVRPALGALCRVIDPDCC